MTTSKNKIPRNEFKTEEVKDPHLANFDIEKETEEHTNIWKHILCSWIGIINIIKMSKLFKTPDIFSEILNKNYYSM